MTRNNRRLDSPVVQRADGPMTVGYVRTVIGQSPVTQISMLFAAGVAENDIYVERANGHK